MNDSNTHQLGLGRPLTLLELCDYLGAKRSTIDQYNREGLPRFYVGKECRYIPSKVVAWLERRCNHKVQPTKEMNDPRKEIRYEG